MGRRYFAEVFERRDPLRRSDVEVESYLGTRAARIKLRSGRTALVESLLPLRTPDDTGRLAPVDLSLEDVGTSWAPRHGLAKISMPKRLRAGEVQLQESGVRVEIASPRGDSIGSAEDGGVFYPNAEADTDVAVVPTLSGVEVSWLLRSAQSPETFSLRYGGGVTLRDRQDGSVEVLRDSQVVAGIAPPLAWDADREAVAMSMRADGDTLRVTVEHHDRDVAYPIVADPSIRREVLLEQLLLERRQYRMVGHRGLESRFQPSGSSTYRDDPNIAGYDRTYNFGDTGE